MTPLTATQKIFMRMLTHRSRKFVNIFLGVPITFLALYAVPLFVFYASQVGEVPEAIKNLLTPFSYLASGLFAVCSLATWVVFVFMLYFAGMSKNDFDTETYRKHCKSMYTLSGIIPLSRFAYWRTFLYGSGSAILLWASAHYFTGTIYMIVTIANLVIYVFAKGAVYTFVQKLDDETLNYLLEKPWNKKKELVPLTPVT